MTRPFAHSRRRRAKRRACVFAGALIAAAPIYSTNARAQAETEDPCGGPSALLAIMDRPTVSDSACVVPEKQVVLELGGQWTRFRDGTHGFNLPEAEFRAGIPGNNELVFLPPNYNRQTGAGMAASGPSAAVVGVKHELGYTGKWLGAVESLVTLPSGSAAFGSSIAGKLIADRQSAR